MKDYVGKRCWKAYGFKHIRMGTIEEQKMENLWLLVLIKWDDGSESWEKVVNVSFSPLSFP